MIAHALGTRANVGFPRPPRASIPSVGDPWRLHCLATHVALGLPAARLASLRNLTGPVSAENHLVPGVALALLLKARTACRISKTRAINFRGATKNAGAKFEQ
jgi:hypothetical protein